MSNLAHYCKLGDLKKVKEILSDSNSREYLNARDGGMCTPLYYACEGGFIEIVKLLLEQPEIDVNAGKLDCILGSQERRKSVDYEFTPLYIACKLGTLEHVKIVRELMKKPGLNVNHGGPIGELTPLVTTCYSITSDHFRILKDLLKHKEIDVNEEYPLGVLCDKTVYFRKRSIQKFMMCQRLLTFPNLKIERADDVKVMIDLVEKERSADGALFQKAKDKMRVVCTSKSSVMHSRTLKKPYLSDSDLTLFHQKLNEELFFNAFGVAARRKEVQKESGGRIQFVDTSIVGKVLCAHLKEKKNQIVLGDLSKLSSNEEEDDDEENEGEEMEEPPSSPEEENNEKYPKYFWIRRIEPYCKNESNIVYLGAVHPTTGLPEGRGVLFCREWWRTYQSYYYYRVYQGNFVNGKRSGEGCEYDKSTNFRVFKGHFKNGKRHGKGIEYKKHLNSANSSDQDLDECGMFVFEGWYRNGLRHGRGEYFDEGENQYNRSVFQDGKLVKKISSFHCPMIDYSEIEKYFNATPYRNQLSVLGSGGYGTVYRFKSSWLPKKIQKMIEKELQLHHPHKNKKKRENDELYLAVKILNTANEFSKLLYSRTIRNGLELFGRIEDTKNIVKVLASIEGRRIGIVMELMADSVDRLIEASNGEIGLEEKCRWLHETAKGVRELHEKQIIHRDLKWGNVMTDSNVPCTLKICDFDTVREDDNSYRLNQMEYTNKDIGTGVFLAPEVSSGQYGAPVDVYSFGLMIYCLLVEINNPYLHMSRCKECDVILTSMNIMDHVRKCQLRPPIENKIIFKNEKEKNEYEWLIDLIESCWDGEPQSRPTFQQICKILECQKKRRKCYCVFKVKRVIEEERTDGKFVIDDHDKFVRLFLFKPKIINLKSVLKKKFGEEMFLGEVRIMYNEKPLESDEDVIEMVKSEEHPQILLVLSSSSYVQLKKLKNEGESQIMNDSLNQGITKQKRNQKDEGEVEDEGEEDSEERGKDYWKKLVEEKNGEIRRRDILLQKYQKKIKELEKKCEEYETKLKEN